jgi:hypothetical protein
MVAPNYIPTLDPNPLPAPYWVFKLLLVVTFFLHILAMNSMLGGAVLALVAKWRGGSRGVKESRSRGVEDPMSTSRPLNSSTSRLLDSSTPDYGARVFFDLTHKLPVLLPATITLGIAPLLFVQVLYGQFFYTSSIILAWPWFLVLVFLTAAYYGFYYVSFKAEAAAPGAAQASGTGYHGPWPPQFDENPHARRPRGSGGSHQVDSRFRGNDQGESDPLVSAPATEKRSSRAAIVLLLSVLLIFAIGFIYSNNLTLSQTPSRWGAKYFANPGGWDLNLSEPTLVPRFLHFFTAALAVGGLLLVLLAWTKWERDAEYARYIFHFGGKAFMYATMAEFVVGLWFVISLPSHLRMLFFGNNTLATILLMAGITGAMAAIYAMAMALGKDNIRLAAFGVTGLTAAVILCMSVMRDLLRDAYLKADFQPHQFAVKTQWSVLPIFLVLFVAGVILWFVMLKRYGLFRGAEAMDQALPPPRSH